MVSVTLASSYTEIGTLDLWCVAKNDQGRWKLEYSVRDIVEELLEDLDDEEDTASEEDID